MKAFAKCPVCNGELVEKEVEKLLRGGNNTASLFIKALVCLQCGERLYPEKTVRKFELIRKKLEKQDTQEFQLIGQSYKVS